MAQRTPKSKNKTSTLQWVEGPKPRRWRARNDNAETQWSGLSFRNQKRRQKRMEDLTWQVNFAQLMLRRWSNEDNLGWTPFDKLLKTAQDEQTRLGKV